MAADPRSRRGEARIPTGDAGAFDQWMTRIATLDDTAVEDLLRGDTPAGCEDLAPVAELTSAVRHTATARPPAMSPALRAQIRQRPAVPPRYAGAGRRRLQVAVAAVTLAVVGVAAAQNALPAAAQRAVAAAADLVGIHVPRPDDRADEPSTSTDGTQEDDRGTGSTGASNGSGGPGAEDPGPSPSTDPTSPAGGPPDQTPGGATPADPGAPGDGEPATPATPPAQGGGANGTGSVNGNGSGNGSGSVNGSGNGSANGTGSANAEVTGRGAQADDG